MKKNRYVLFIISGMLFGAQAGVPVLDMSLTSIAIEYTGLWRGEAITKLDIPAHENAHHISIHYSPVPYVAMGFGIGMAGYSVDTVRSTQFKGVPGISPSFNLSGYSPRIADVVRFTLGAKGYYLHTRNEDKSHLYAGGIVNPGLGVIFSIGNNLEIELGGRGLVIFGEMSEDSSDAISYFSNRNLARGYLSLLMHTPSEGAFCMMDFDASPAAQAEWNKGPVEASISFSLGFILRTEKYHRAYKKASDSAYPGYEDLKKRQEQMEEEMK
ncbi:MAG: hypothetical protein JW768_09700 [Chitinispirillaceae bacterium]|nr:hypothetical protein [Chitinispirillaceae bacterium]